MEIFLQFFLWIPLLGFLIGFLCPRKREGLISTVVFSTVGLHLLAIAVFVTLWLIQGLPTLNIKQLVLYRADHIEIALTFYFDKSTAMFGFVGSTLAFLVSVFSRYYLHREEGFKRFFQTMLFFFLGYNLVVFAGNFETLFLGWEILGICSFLLIAFYRDRFLPVKNALKVISIYRLADVCLLLAMWMSHHLWHENVSFLKLDDEVLVAAHVDAHHTLSLFIAIAILIAAAIKSAQIPFTSWLPRAMEGPTTSSAIFYGSLSVNLGVFLLLRTHFFWEHVPAIKWLVIALGLGTCLAATGIARVQSTVKTQIAYASAAQLGVIFIEVALGFHVLALIHFAGNAFLRTYQLLVSPSVLSYLVHDQFYNFAPRKFTRDSSSLTKAKESLYILCIKEWNLDSTLQRTLWDPFKWIGRQVAFLTHRATLAVFAVALVAGVYFLNNMPRTALLSATAYLFAAVAVVLILSVFAERGDAKRGWLLVSASHCFIALAVAVNRHVGIDQVILYLSGTLVSALVGYVCLRKMSAIDSDLDLNKYHGHAYEHPRLSLIFLLSCLGLGAFPITPAFIGFDLLLTHIRFDQVILILFASVCFVFMELAVLRIYARIFLGQHKRPYHAMAYRSS